MTEIITISDDDDLEEGEIADEPIIISEWKPREKKLPRRYVLHENKGLNSKCTKHHKHTCRHKKHHKSYSHRSLKRHKIGVKQLGHKKSSSLQSDHRKNPSSHTSCSTEKSAFKNFSSPRREQVAPIKQNSNNQLHTKNVNSSQQIFTREKTSKELKEKDENFNCMHIQKDHSLSRCVTESLSDKKLDSLPTKQDCELIKPIIIFEAKVNNEESEDEEELRRIALSTCSKGPITNLKHIPEEPVASFSNVNNVIPMNQNSCNQISSNGDIFLSDNYEVVDMELDDDSSIEDASSNDLFVIDKNPLESLEGLPANNFNQNRDVNSSSEKKEPSLENELHLPSIQCQSNDDFEEELLRAEVIASMISVQQKPKKPENQLVPLKSGSEIQVQVPPTKEIQIAQSVKVVKSLPIYGNSPVSNFLNLTRRRVVNKAKLNYSKLISQKKLVVPQQRKINAGAERLVITLNNDSSTEESDEECDKTKGTQENVAVASIEALISDARLKSDIQKTNNTDSNDVSCLSKAQQEEYINLKKILAQKQVMPKRSTTIHDKRALQLKILTKKISVANGNLDKEKKLLSDVQKELLTKKQEYMASKLKAQLLKEQLHAAEVVRAANLESWKQSAAKLDIQKKSVAKHEAIVDLLEKKLNTKSLPQEQNSILSPDQRNNSPAT